MNTGITLRGFEVHANEPSHYRHYHTLFLRVPGAFPTQIECVEFCGAPWYQITLTRPDGKQQMVYSGWRTEAEAQEAFETYPNGKAGHVGCQFEVGYKLTDTEGNYLPYQFCKADAVGAKAWGATWAKPEYGDYAPLKFDLTEAEAREVIAWREQADEQWFAAHPDFLPREEKITQAQVAGLSEGAAEFFVDAKEAFGDDAVALVGPLSTTAIECLECGAVYDEPGHVEPGAMGCDRCG